MNNLEFSLDESFLAETSDPSRETVYDCLILGGGPAAMSAAVYCARKALDCAIIAKSFGGQVSETSAVENWLGFQSVNGKDLVTMFQDHVNSFTLPVKSGAGVTGITRAQHLFLVETDAGLTYKSRTVIVATGKRHRALNIPGERELTGHGVAYCATCDAPFFRDKAVVVAGGGNSAFTTAFDLVRVNASVTLVNFQEGWNADPVLMDRVRAAGEVTFLDNHQIVAIDGADTVEAVRVKNRETGEEQRLDAAGIFIEIGLVSNTGFVLDLVELNDQGEIIIDCACRTSIGGLFAAGDATTVPHKQIVIAAGEGAKAALSAYDYLLKKGLV